MAFVKLDCGILNSTLWVEREPRDVFITALLMAVPYEITEPMPQFEVRSLEPTGFVVPPGWYGFVQAAGPGIVRMAMSDQTLGMDALEKLGAADPESRSSDFEGRRLVRVDGGYLILNYMKYRDKDLTAADRMKRYRQRKKEAELPRNDITVTRNPRRGVTKGEAEAEEQEKETPPPTGGSRKQKPLVSLKTWLETVKAAGEKAIPDDDLVFVYADKVGIPSEFLRLAWVEFRYRYTLPDAKRYIDWRSVFRKAVRGNWLKLWWVDPSGVYALTTAGAQALKANTREAA